MVNKLYDISKLYNRTRSPENSFWQPKGSIYNDALLDNKYTKKYIKKSIINNICIHFLANCGDLTNIPNHRTNIHPPNLPATGL